MKNYYLTALFILFICNSYASGILGMYNFNDGAKGPSNVVQGVVFANEFAIYNSTSNTYTIDYNEPGAITFTNHGNNQNANRYGYITIAPESGYQIVLDSVKATFKTSSTNTKGARCVMFDTPNGTTQTDIIYDMIATNGPEGVHPDWTTKTYIPKNPQGGSGIIGPVTIKDLRYFTFHALQSTASANNLAKWYIDEIIFYGSILNEGDIIVNPTTFPLQYGSLDKTATDTLKVNVFGTATENLSVAITGPDQDKFSVDRASIPAGELTGTYILVTYNPRSRGNHSATLTLFNSGKSLSVPLSGKSTVFFEDFSKVLPSEYELLGSNPAAENIDNYTYKTGWILSDSVSWFRSGNYAMALNIRSSIEKGRGSAVTPALDLSQPFSLSYKSRKGGGSVLNSEMFILADEDTIFYAANSNNTLTDRVADGYIAGSNSKITFLGVLADEGSYVIDNISIDYTSSPALNIAKGSSASAGKAKPGNQKTTSIPLKGYNLTDDEFSIVLNDANGCFSLSKNTFTKSELQAGKNMEITFTAPATEGDYHASVVFSGAGLDAPRTLYLQATSDMNSGIESEKIPVSSVYTSGKILYVKTEQPANISIYNLLGAKVKELQTDGSGSQIELNPGCYVVKTGSFTGKVIIK